MPPPTDLVPSYWYTYFKQADALSKEFTLRYRCGYVLTIVLTALAPLLGAVAVACVVAASGEVNIYADLGLLFGALELAELCRQRQNLAPLGWALPTDHVQLVSDAKRQSWVTGLFAAVQRSAPMMEGSFGSAHLRAR